jgi:hypothetical protein
MFHAFETTFRRHLPDGLATPAVDTGSTASTGPPGASGDDGEETGFAATDDTQAVPGPLADLPGDLRSAHGPHPLHGCYEVPSALEMASLNLYDPTDFRRGLSEWLAENDRGRLSQTNARAAAAAELSDPAAVRQVSDDIRSALISALAIGMAHSAEMLMAGLPNHPLIRLSAVSHPFVLGTLLEGMLKKIADIPDVDSLSRVAPRYEEKIAAALVNWNFVQPLLDTVLKSPLARSLKVVATAAIGGVRDLTERKVLRGKLAALPDDAPEGARKLTPMESVFVICLLCALRNVSVDLPRQIVKSQSTGALPAASGAAEKLLRQAMLGSQVPGGLPSACIAAQAAFVGVVGNDAWRVPDEHTGLRLGYQVNNPF